MSEDPLRLREEIAKLKKEISVLNSNKEKISQVVESLHKEEIQYLKEIPIYKKQAQDAINGTIAPLKALDEINQKVSIVQKQYDSLQSFISESENKLDELKINKLKIVKEVNEISEALRNGHSLLQTRESAVLKREQDCQSKEEFYKKLSFSLDKREVEIDKKEKELAVKHLNLKEEIDTHNTNVDAHGKKVDIFIEQKQFLREDQQLLKERMENLNKLIKDNSDIKAAMLKQSEKMDAEIKKAQAKQSALDMAINDLKNEEKRIKILELRVVKMAKDANIEKELKDLMESLK